MITITKKESSLVWMLRKAKTARLVITLYRHITDKLPTSYRHITNCRPTVGRLSADCRPTDSLCFGENLSADSRPTVGQQTTDSRPTVGRQVFWGALLHNYQGSHQYAEAFMGLCSVRLLTCNRSQNLQAFVLSRRKGSCALLSFANGELRRQCRPLREW